MANIVELVRMGWRSIDDLKPTVTRYDETRGVWFFTVELHDDDLPNADFKPLWRFLETAPTTRAVFVASRESWKSTADWFALVIDGKATARHIIDYAETDPSFVSSAQATELIESIHWPPAKEVLASLEAHR